MSHAPDWDQVSPRPCCDRARCHFRAAANGTTHELIWNDRSYPPKALLGTAYEFATGQRLASGDFEGGKAGAVRVLGRLGFTVQQIS